MKPKNMVMGLMCVACCAVPLTSILISTGIFAGAAVSLGSLGGMRSIGFALGFALIGAAGFSIWRRGRAKAC